MIIFERVHMFKNYCIIILIFIQFLITSCSSGKTNGQRLSVSPLSIDFGTQFDGNIIQKNVTISNLGSSPINYKIGTISNNTFTIELGY